MPPRASIAALTVSASLAAVAWTHAAAAQTAGAEDRYGPPSPETLYGPPPGGALSWPGKAQPQADAPPRPVASASYAARPGLPTSIYDAQPQPRVDNTRAAYEQSPYPDPPYARPPAAPASAAAQAQASQFPGAQAWPAAHYYSVDRQFGLKPDPIPLPKQFFAGTDVDMAQPPPPPPLTSAQANTPTGRALLDEQQSPAGAAN